MENIYRRNYNLLKPLLDILNANNAIKIESQPYMDLHIDNLGKKHRDGTVIALAHYYRANGDSIPDPDMEIAVYADRGMVEALTYQDSYLYQEVYFINPNDHREMMYPKLKKDLNSFLNLWLRNIQSQGFHVGEVTVSE